LEVYGNGFATFMGALTNNRMIIDTMENNYCGTRGLKKKKQ
jgi:hypothetical protein